MKMKHAIAAAVSLTFFGSVQAYAQGMEISPNGSRPSVIGSSETFTGLVVVDPLFAANDATPSTGGHVMFAAGARSAWHTHPAGQFLIVTSGAGWVQEEGGEKQEIKP